MSLKEVKSQSSGLLQRLCTITSTPLPVMSGAMAAYSMRYGHWDANHSMMSLMLRSVIILLYYLGYNSLILVLISVLAQVYIMQTGGIYHYSIIHFSPVSMQTILGASACLDTKFT